MDWPNERYVRVYTRDTTTWKLLSWQARTVLLMLFRKADRSGVLEVGDDGVEGLAAVIELPMEVAGAGISELVKRGTVERRSDSFVLPKFIEAQEAKTGDATRQRESRERRRAEALRDSQQQGAFRNRMATIKGESLPSGSIYVLADGAHERFKIGFTANSVSNRVRQIETASGLKLDLLTFFDGSAEEERAIHKQFAKLREEGEWFRAHSDLTDWINSVTACHAPSHGDQVGHAGSHAVTPSLTEPSRTKPNRTEKSSDSAAPRAPSGPHQVVFAAWNERFLSATNGPATWSPRLHADLKQLLEKHDETELVRRINIAFTSPPPWPPGTWDFATFVQHIDKVAQPSLAIRGGRAEPLPPTSYPQGKVTL